MEVEKAKTKVEEEPSHGRYFMLRYILSLIFGWLFVGVLIGTISIVLGSLIGSSGGDSYYMRQSYALLLAALVVFGAVHLTMAFSVNVKTKLDERTEKHTRIFGTIYVIGLVGLAAVFMVMALFPLFGAMTGLTDMDQEEMWQIGLTGLIAVILLADMIRYHTRTLVRVPRWVYTITMGTVTILVAVLFVIFPAGEVRRSVQDQKIIDDLNLIEGEISTYVSRVGKLPNSLQDLGLTNLNRKLRDYEFTADFNNYEYHWRYTLCTDGFMNDRSGGDTVSPRASDEIMPQDDYWVSGGDIMDIDIVPYPYNPRSFWSHKKGYDCFDLQAHRLVYDDFLNKDDYSDVFTR